MKKSSLLILLLIMPMILLAQKPEDFTGSLLWKVSGNGLEKPSYVFGTYHLVGEELIEKVPGLQEAIDETEQTVGELTPEEMGAAQLKMMPYMMMPQGKGYKDILSEEKYNLLDILLKVNMGAGLDQFGMLSPGMISMSIVIALHVKNNPDFNPANFEGIDGYLLRIAGESGKKVLGLDTADVQIEAIFSPDTPMEEQIDALICSLQHFDYMEKQANLDEDYYRGDLYKMYDEAFNDPDAPCLEYTTEEHKNVLLKNRNDNWIAQLPAIMAEAPALIAVGALHLAGEEGILYQLHLLGYKVEKVE